MNADEYQELSTRTLTQDGNLVPLVLGLVGESGEVADQIKKFLYHGHDLDESKLAGELGDVLWYVAALCTRLGLLMGEVMAGNVEKLRKRYPDGFSSQASQERKDLVEAAKAGKRIRAELGKLSLETATGEDLRELAKMHDVDKLASDMSDEEFRERLRNYKGTT